MSPQDELGDAAADRRQIFETEEADRLERARLWPYVWHMACSQRDVAETGDFIEYEIADKSVIVVRTEEGVKAFLNSCPHRGVRIASGAGNCRHGLSCPFHGWRWTMDGRNIFYLKQHLINQKDRALSTLDLIRCRSELSGGLVFINLDNAAPPLADIVGVESLNDHAARAKRSRLLRELSVELPINWKTAIHAIVGARTALMRGKRALTPLMLDPAKEVGIPDWIEFLRDLPVGGADADPEKQLALPNFVGMPIKNGFLSVRSRPVTALSCRLEVWIYRRS